MTGASSCNDLTTTLTTMIDHHVHSTSYRMSSVAHAQQNGSRIYNGHVSPDLLAQQPGKLRANRSRGPKGLQQKQQLSPPTPQHTNGRGRSRARNASSSNGACAVEKMRRSNSPVCRRRENRLTRISLMIVWLFLFCHIWKIIPTAYEVIYGDMSHPGWLRHIQHVSHALILLSSSVNFLIYAAL